MDWLFDGKSVASSAKKVVSDMHKQLDNQSKQIQQLQRSLVETKAANLGYIQGDISNLERRKARLLEEVSLIDAEIFAKSEIHRKMKEQYSLDNERVPSTAPASAPDLKVDKKNRADSSKERGSGSDTSSSRNIGYLQSTAIQSPEIANPTKEKTQESDQSTNVMVEQQSLAEGSDILETVRRECETLFIVHRNNSEEIVVYTPPEDDDDDDDDEANGEAASVKDIVLLHKIKDLHHASRVEDLSTYELMMTYGVKIVPNHERDFPEVQEMPVPLFLLATSRARGSRGSRNGTSSDKAQRLGSLLGAFEIPLLPGVVIDVWYEGTSQSQRGSHAHAATSSSSGGYGTAEEVLSYQNSESTAERRLYWASTTVDGVGFAVLTRLFVTIEAVWGVSTVTRVDLFGAHPTTGMVVKEAVTATGE